MDDNWSTDGNWTPSPGAGGPDGADVEVIFDTTSSGVIVDLDQNRTVGTLTIDDSRNYAISNNTLTLDVSSGSAAITVGNSNGNGAHTISSNLTLADDVIITNNSTGNFTLSGALTGTGGVTKNGTGDLTFSGDNTYSGATNINAGRILVPDNLETDPFANSDVTIASGAFLLFGDSFIGEVSLGSLAGSGTVEASFNALNVGRNNTSTTFSGSLTTQSILFKQGTGTFTLKGSGNSMSELEHSGGDLVIDGASGDFGDISMFSSGTTTIRNTTSAFEASEIETLVGATLTITNAQVLGLDILSNLGTANPLTIENGSTVTTTQFAQSNSNTGTTIVDQSTLTLGRFNVSNRGTIAISDASGGDPALTIGDANNSTFRGVIEDHTSGSGSVLKTGSGTITLTGENTYTGGTTIEEGTLQLGDGGTTGSIVGNVANDGMLAFDRSDNLTFDSVISGTGGVTKNGTGDLTLSGDNTYEGATNINAGRILVPDNLETDPFANSDVTIASGASLLIGQTNFGGITLGSLAGGGTVTNAINNLSIGGNNTSTTFSGTITSGSTSEKQGTGTFTLTGSGISLNGGLDVRGGNLVIDGASGNFGGIDANSINTTTTTIRNTTSAFDASSLNVVNDSTLTINNAQVLGLSTLTNFSSANPVTIENGSTVTTAEFTQGSNQTTIVDESSLSLGRFSSPARGTIAISDASGGDPALTFGNANNSTFEGVIEDHTTGSGSVLKTGSGTITLSGSNTFSGGMTINAGVVSISISEAVGTGTVTLDGGSLDLNGQTISNPVGFGSSGGSLGGSGTISGALSLTGTDQVISPGASPGTLNFGTNQSWDSFSYAWELNTWTGLSAGTDFDQISVTGSLTLTGADPGDYILDITSLTAGNLTGDLSNFTETNQSWTIVSTSGGVSGFDASFWDIQTGNFSSSPVYQGSFFLSQNGGDLVLSYAAIPEPRVYGVLAGLLVFLVALRNRHRGVSG